MTNIYKCKTCGVASSDGEHLCNAEEIQGKYDYCGQDFESEKADMCEPMRDSLRFECDTCGRPAESPDLLCRPTKVHG